MFSVCGGVGVLFSGGVSPEYLGHQTSNSSLEPAVCHYRQHGEAELALGQHQSQYLKTESTHIHTHA